MTTSAVPEPFVTSRKGVAAEAFPLTPLQAGMLYQALREGSSGGGYDVEQLHFTLTETIDAVALGEAWTHVARVHPSLSTCFVWQGLPVPCQRVQAEVVIPVHVEDWSGLAPGAREERRAAFLREDRARGFDLEQAPLLRVALFAVEPERTELVWTVHHGIVDGRSFPIVLRDVFEAYDALRDHREPRLAAPASTHRDFVGWLSTQDRKTSHGFFRALLHEQRMPTPLPGGEPTHRGSGDVDYVTVSSSLSGHLLGRLRARAGRENVPLGALVAAAWAIVLHRYTRETTVLFGSTRHCRRTALTGQAAGIVGVFINTLPLRVTLSSETTLAALVADLAGQAVALRAHEHTPLSEIQGQSGVPRTLPLFESLLTFETRGLRATLRATGGRRWQTVGCSIHEKPAFPMNVLVEADDELTARLLFDPRRIRPDTGERLLASLAFVFSELADDGRSTVGEIDVVPPEEREKLLLEWNTTARVVPAHLVQGGFEARAREAPDTIALESGPERLSYRELERRARSVAHALQERSVRPGTFVGVCSGRGTDLVVSLLGVMMSGAAYVPLDPREPGARLVSMLEDASASLVVTGPQHRELFAAYETLDPAGVPPAPQFTLRESHATEADPCYAIFTSGSTGKPNGAVLTHRAVVNTLDWVNRTFEVGSTDRVLFVNSPSFDLSVYDIFGVLGAGGTVVIANEAALADPAELVRMLHDERITIWNSAPGAWQRVLGQVGTSAFDAALRLVLLSGDWIPIKMPGATTRAFPRARVVSLGGATEAAIWSNWFPIERVDPSWTSIPYGRPIQNARYHALDERMKPVPVGVVGDLYIGGVCVAEGYLNRPVLNAERFVADPFAPPTHPGRLYKTGDLVRYFPDGNLEFLGRADFQVKIRGFRVELGEVEITLLALSGVREAVCSARVDASGEKSLIAYLVTEAGAEQDEASVKASASRVLPLFMVPSRVVFVSALPLSKNGKVDRGALPEPRSVGGGRTVTAPRGERELRLVKVWERVLEREPIGVTDDFFEIGGHSLLSLTLLAACQGELGLPLSLPRFLERPTIEGMVQSIERSAEPTQVSHRLYTYNGQGRRPPVVLIGGGHFALLYREFPKLFEREQPVHFFQASASEVADDAFATLIEPEVLAACPAGPVVVGGFDRAAGAALALAHRLQGRGRPVPLVLFFDGEGAREPSHPSLSRRVLGAGQRLRERLRQRFERRPVATEPLRAEAVVVSAESTLAAGEDPGAPFRAAVTGSVDVIRVPGEHMAFLAPEQHHRVVDAIRLRIDNIARVST